MFSNDIPLSVNDEASHSSTELDAYKTLLGNVLRAADPENTLPPKAPLQFMKDAYNNGYGHNDDGGDISAARKHFEGVKSLVHDICMEAWENKKFMTKLASSGLFAYLNSKFYGGQSWLSGNKLFGATIDKNGQLINQTNLGIGFGWYFYLCATFQNFFVGGLSTAVLFNELFETLSEEQKILIQEKNQTSGDLVRFKAYVITILVGGFGATTVQALLGINQGFGAVFEDFVTNFPVNTFSVSQLPMKKVIFKSNTSTKVASALQHYLSHLHKRYQF